MLNYTSVEWKETQYFAAELEIDMNTARPVQEMIPLFNIDIFKWYPNRYLKTIEQFVKIQK